MRYILLLLLTALIISCQSRQLSGPAKRSFSIDSVIAHILKMNESFGERFLTDDSAFYVDRYCVDAEVYSPNMPAVKGREAIRKFFYNDGNYKEAKIELSRGIFYGGPDYVVEDGAYNFPDGKGGSVDKGKFIAVWKKEDGTWKLYREIWNTDLATKQ